MVVIDPNKYKSDDIKFIPANKPVYYIPTFRNVTAESEFIKRPIKYVESKEN